VKKVTESTTLYKRKLTAVLETVQGLDGRQFQHETVRHPGAVVILPVNERGDFVLVEQYRHSIGGVILEAPAGTLELGEDPATCAKRELSEEIGMGASTWRSLGVLFPAPGFCDERQHLFLAQDLFPQKGIPDEDEEIAVITISPIELEQAIIDGRVNDAKTCAIYLRAKLSKLF
jgi:ADP-ribose pyrophosphatase